jgi:hypothetical protein
MALRTPRLLFGVEHTSIRAPELSLFLDTEPFPIVALAVLSGSSFYKYIIIYMLFWEF